LVIGLADAVVEPAAVVVEVVHTPVARAAVLRVVPHVGVTHLAEELVTPRFEVRAANIIIYSIDLLILQRSPVCIYGRVGRVCPRGHRRVVDHCHEHYTVGCAHHHTNGRRVGECHHADKVESVGVETDDDPRNHLEGVQGQRESIWLHSFQDYINLPSWRLTQLRQVLTLLDWVLYKLLVLALG
jgi:hypothetical protein